MAKALIKSILEKLLFEISGAMEEKDYKFALEHLCPLFAYVLTPTQHYFWT